MPSIKKSKTKKVNSKDTKNISLPLVNDKKKNIIKTISDNQESDNQESDNQESDNQESDNQESDNQESNNQESDNQESDNQESNNQESNNQESNNQESNNQESNNQESDSNDSDNSSEESNSNTSDDEDNVKIVNISKDKKLKKTWQEIIIEWERVSLEIKENECKHKELLEILYKNEKVRNDLERQRNRLYSVLSKSHDDEIKRVKKEKPKRKGNKDGGFNKESPVPPKLIKYLGLDEGIELSRPKIMSLLNDKFKTEGLKQGQITTLDKNASNLLDKDENYEIKFTAFQSFLKEFYDEVDFNKEFYNGNEFNKELDIPTKLAKYIGLEKETKLSHFKISRLLLDKLYPKEQKENDQKNKIKKKLFLNIDKTAAKILGKEENSKINFIEFTKFFKEFYTNV